MTPGTFKYWNVNTLAWEGIAAATPMPCVGTGEALTPAGYLTTASYVEVAGARLDTKSTGHRSLCFTVAGATQSTTSKVCGSNDAVAWTDLVCFDETGTAQSATGVVIAAGANDVFIIPDGSALGAYRYYTVFAKDTVGGTHGTVTVLPFSK